MARPKADSLNCLAEIVSQALPLYRECGSIINHLDQNGCVKSNATPGDHPSVEGSESRSKDAHHTPHNVFELRAHSVQVKRNS